MMQRLVLVSIFAAAAPPVAWPASGPAVAGSPHVTARLVAEDATLAAGMTTWIGLHLKMAPGWHTYWKNPGDSGLATRIRFRLPEGFSVSDLQWPYPERIASGPLVSYGYHDEVLLMARLVPPPELKWPSVGIAAEARWLECEEACVPGKAALTLELPVRDRPARDSEWAPRFAAARARLPRAAEGWTARLLQTHPAVVVELRPPRAAALPRQATFFPDRPRLIKDAVPARVTKMDGGYRLELAPAANPASPYPGLSGVLVAEGWSPSGGTLALTVEARP